MRSIAIWPWHPFWGEFVLTWSKHVSSVAAEAATAKEKWLGNKSILPEMRTLGRCALPHRERLTNVDFYAIRLFVVVFHQSLQGILSQRFKLRKTTKSFLSFKRQKKKKKENRWKPAWFDPANGWETLFGGDQVALETRGCSAQLIYPSNTANGLLCSGFYHVIIRCFVNEGGL